MQSAVANLFGVLSIRNISFNAMYWYLYYMPRRIDTSWEV
jgi:hypothetical protein